MKKKNRKKRMIAFGIIVVLLICLGIFLRTENQKRQEETAKYNELDSRIRPLNVKKSRLTLQLEKLQEDYEAGRKPKATSQVIFTELDPKVYEICYPLLKERRFTGVLSLSQTEFPGVKDCMTQEQFDELIKAGWTVCVTRNNQKALDKWWPDLKYGIQQIGLEVPKTIYCPKGTYRADLDQELREAGFDIVVHHEEAGRALIQTQYEETLWHLGALGLMGGATKTRFDEAIKAKGNIIYLVGFDREDEKYEERAFTVMLDYFQSYSEDNDLVVGSMEDARNHYYSRLQEVSAEEERVYLEKKAELDAQLADIEAQLEKLRSQ